MNDEQYPQLKVARKPSAILVLEGEGVGGDAGELQAHFGFDGVADAEDAVVHQDLAVGGRGADAGDADAVHEIDGTRLELADDGGPDRFGRELDGGGFDRLGRLDR